MASLGLFKRREIWFPTFRCWGLLLLTVVVLSGVSVVWTVPFLAPSRPNHQGILIVEGWLPDYALEEAKATFESHPYRLLVVTGVPIDQGFHISKEKNFAQLAATTLKALGMKPEAIVPISCSEVPRDRTFATAIAVKRWLETAPEPGPIDVFTLGVHARRTWLLYRLALGKAYTPGIIAAHDQRYDPARWWTTSNGVRTVSDEVIAYFYAKLFFHPRISTIHETTSP